MENQIKIGDRVITETFSITTTAPGRSKITGTRFLKGIVLSIEGDSVKIDTPGRHSHHPSESG